MADPTAAGQPVADQAVAVRPPAVAARAGQDPSTARAPIKVLPAQVKPQVMVALSAEGEARTPAGLPRAARLHPVAVKAPVVVGLLALMRPRAATAPAVVKPRAAASLLAAVPAKPAVAAALAPAKAAAGVPPAAAAPAAIAARVAAKAAAAARAVLAVAAAPAAGSRGER